jgi:hypothetical protein
MMLMLLLTDASRAALLPQQHGSWGICAETAEVLLLPLTAAAAHALIQKKSHQRLS